jgi:hypothetical protein
MTTCSCLIVSLLRSNDIQRERRAMEDDRVHLVQRLIQEHLKSGAPDRQAHVRFPAIGRPIILVRPPSTFREHPRGDRHLQVRPAPETTPSWRSRVRPEAGLACQISQIV